MKKPIKLHWASSKPNFGDQLSPLIVECVSGRPVEHASVDKCDLVALGSLLQRVKNHWWSRRLHIWGAGFIEDGKKLSCRHHVHALRGPLSAERLGLSEPVAYGDPGLLADRLLDGRHIPKKYRLSIIAHYKDKGSPMLKALCEQNPDARVVDVFSCPMDILHDIAASHCVVSSAMHGLIAADALSVPNCRVVLSDQLRGGDFKFRDYYGGLPFGSQECKSADFGKEEFERVIGSFDRPGLVDIKEALEKAFPRL